MRKKCLVKKLLLFALGGMILAGGFKSTSINAYALTEAEIIAYLKENGYTTGTVAPGHEYGGSYELGSASANRELDEIVRQRAAERGLTIRQYLEQTGQTCPPSSPNYAILDKDLSGNGNTVQKEEVTKEPTCMETGLKTFTCECGNSYTEVVEKTEHTYKEEITKSPTCKEKGEKTLSVVCVAIVSWKNYQKQTMKQEPAIPQKMLHVRKMD